MHIHILGPSGLTLPRFSLLKNSDALGDCGTAQLARKVGLEHRALVRNLRLLAAQERMTDGKKPGGKCNVWHSPESGRSALARGRPLWEQAQQIVEEALGTNRLKEFEEMPDSVCAAGEKCANRTPLPDADGM